MASRLFLLDPGNSPRRLKMDVLIKMLEALVVTLREGVEAALVVGIILAYLRKVGKEALKGYVYRGLIAAIVFSILGAVAFQGFGLDPENEILEGTTMFLAAGLVVSLMLWMWQTGRTLKRRMEAHLEAVTARRAGFGLLTFTFLMILREGIETVLFLSALSGTIGANPFYNALGGGLGLALAFFLGVLLIQGSLRIDLKRFFSVTGFVLLLLVFKLIANGLHEFFEVGLLPSNETALAIVGYLTRESTSILILILFITLPALTFLREALRKGEVPAIPGETQAERRKRRAELRSSRMWAGAAAGMGLVISLLLLLLAIATATRGYFPAPTPLTLTGPILRIPLADLQDRPMRKYTVAIDGVSVRFFIMRNQEGKIALAFDACAICPPKGYLLDGDQVICRNCDAPIAFDTIGIAGGCNPLPLKARIEGDEVVITAADLAEGKARFGGKRL